MSKVVPSGTVFCNLTYCVIVNNIIFKISGQNSYLPKVELWTNSGLVEKSPFYVTRTFILQMIVSFPGK